jgi:hypothetical protein
MRRQEWWGERERAGIAAYWLYQFVGNLSPELLRESELLARVRAADDGWEILSTIAEDERYVHDGARWSYCRDLGRTRLLVVDSRCGRILDEGRRSILDDEEWEWLEHHLEGDYDHVLIATSDPVLLAPGLHHVERWGEAICHGAWGARFARWGEQLRRALDFDHWAAFGDSFQRLTGLIERAASGRYGPAPASITILSGDVHHAYLAEVAFKRSAGTRSAVHQAVCSPFRNALDARERKMIETGNSHGGVLVGRTLARQVATRTLDGREAEL